MIRAMMTALGNLFKPVHTHPYPAKPIEHPKEYRGLIEYGVDHCIFCDKCEKVCPPGAILFDHHLDGTKTYHYNAWLCIYCGECVRNCPKTGEALWQSETKAMPAVKEEDVNTAWFTLEKQIEENRAAVREAKAAAKAAKAAEKKDADPAAD